MALKIPFPLNTKIKTVDWKQLVAEVEDLKAPHDAYEFSRKTFKEGENAGVYNDNPN